MIDGIAYVLLGIECTETAKMQQFDATIWRLDKITAIPILPEKDNQAQPCSTKTEGKIAKTFKSQPKAFVKYISTKAKINSESSSPIIDEIVAFFNTSSSFYFSNQFDITKTLQR